jgi:glycosyltransferase involved in cell wall biosynthesis
MAMKVLLNCHLPFLLAHGGTQVQIEQTKAGLERIGIEVEYLRWWDEAQTGDILHHVGWLPCDVIDLAHRKGWRVVKTILLTETCNRSPGELFARKLMVRGALGSPLPRKIKRRLQWSAYHLADRMVVGLEIERRVLEKVYGLPKARVSVVPLGLSDVFLNAGPAARTAEHLICTGTIGPSKNSLELAGYAAAALVPLKFVGKPFDYGSDYWKKFEKLVDGKIIQHVPHVGSAPELIALLGQSRGYVLMSRFENWSLAAHEAAACGLPMLVPDQPWSRERFGSEVSYFPKQGSGSPAETLKRFYERCPALSPPKVKPHSWVEVAEMLRPIYEDVLATGRGKAGS